MDDNQLSTLRTLQEYRNRLLDLSMRNPLLSFNERGKKIVPLKDELPDQVYSELCPSDSSKAQPMPLDPWIIEEPLLHQLPFGDTPITQKTTGLEHLPDPTSPEYTTAPQHADNRLQTSLPAKDYDGRLRNIHADYGDYIHATGSNFLYLAIGFLKWYRPQDSDKARYSPLLLIPLEMSRVSEIVELTDPETGETVQAKQFIYSVKWSGEEIQSNHTFRQLLLSKSDLPDIEFPVFDQDNTPDSHLQSIQTIINSMRFDQTPHWEVERKMGIAFFASSKEIMYRDLDPANWDEGKLLTCNKNIRNALGITAKKEPATSGSEPQDKTDPDYFYRKPIATVMSADSSQMAAINRVLEKKSMVIQGPPGTGKSQTISNLLAAAMAEGKKILFMAEKSEALDVVQRRLEEVGLGPYCLELHSNKTTTKHLCTQLKERKSASAPGRSATLAKDLNRLISDSDELNLIGDELKKACSVSSIPIYKVFWKAEKSEQKLREYLVDSYPHLEFSLLPFPKTELNALAESETTLQPIARAWTDGILTSTSYWDGFIPTKRLFENDLGRIKAILLAGAENLGSWSVTAGSYPREWELSQASGKSITHLSEGIEKLQELPDGYIPEVGAALANSAISQAELVSIQTATEDLLCIQNTQALVYLKQQLELKGPDLLPTAAAIAENLAKSFDTLGLYIEDYNHHVSTMENVAAFRQSVDELASLSNITKNVDSEASLAHLLSLAHQTINLDSSVKSALTPAHFLVDRTRRSLEDAENLSNELSILKESTSVDIQWERLLPVSEIDHLVSDLTELSNSRIKLRFFGRLYRAKQKAKGFAKHPQNVLQKSFCNSLLRFKEFSKLAEEFTKNSSLNEFLGSSFSGLETNWPALKSAALISESLLQLTSPNDSEKRYSLLKGLRRSEIDLVRLQAQKEKVDQLFARFKNHLERDEIHSFADFHQDLSEDEIEKRAPFNTLNHFTIDGDTPLSKVATDFQKSSDARIAQLDLITLSEKVDPSLKTAFEEFAFTNLGRIKKTATWISNVLVNLPLFPKLTKHLISSDTRDRWQKLILLQSKLSTLITDQKSQDIAVSEFVEIKPASAWSLSTSALTCSEISRNWTPDSAEFNNLARLSEYQVALQKAQKIGVSQLIEFCHKLGLNADSLEHVRSYLYWRGAATNNCTPPAPLAEFHRDSIEATRARFSEIDATLSEKFRSDVSATIESLKKNAPAGNATGRVGTLTQQGLIDHYTKTKTTPPIRDFINRSADALQSNFPCWMMSPGSVAKFLPPQKVEFDFIVLDEASQIRPEDALGAIARTAQVVIVGDSQQMPPSNAFRSIQLANTVTENDDDDDDDAIYKEKPDASILEAMESRLDDTILSWHYRSEDEDLISFSNLHYYKEKLLIPPKASSASNETGIDHRQVENATFLAGLNEVEANSVAVEFCSFITKMASKPEKARLSCGVVLMNAKQAARVREIVDTRLLEDSMFQEAYDEYYSECKDPPFIRNLERVQGDQRDVIVVGFTYAPNPTSGKVVRSFGPLGGETGYRRLNVLITRAQKKIIAFTSMRSSDLLGGTNPTSGSSHIANYLKFLETRILKEGGSRTGKDPDSEFEISVATIVRSLGYEVDYQVGVSGFFIDLGIRLPGSTDYFCGLECDGATYHSHPIARDRDALRQQVLEARGWKIYRIWSTDWFHNRQSEIGRLSSNLEKLSRE